VEFRLRRRGERAQRPAVKGVFKNDDFVAAVLRTVFARELDGGLVRLSARVAQEDLCRKGALAELLGQEGRGLRIKKVGRMQQFSWIAL